jgi:hypothetical protein
MKTSRLDIRPLPIPGRWCVHAYYTLCPYAPDGSDRLLLAGANLESGHGEVIVLDAERRIEKRIPAGPVDAAFWHTGFWQTWSPDARAIYFQGGTLDRPLIRRHELPGGGEIRIEGDMEGAPPTGEPILSGLPGMLYAAGYGSPGYRPERAPVPFQQREAHGLFEYTLAPPARCLRLSVAAMLARHPQRGRIEAADREIRARLGAGEGATLMIYCVRWTRDGRRLLFFFGNHCVDASRGEPKLTHVFTTDRDMKELHLAVDLGFGRRGVHWGWQADGEHLIGYGPDPDRPGAQCLAEVRYDGAGYRKLSEHDSGGHPSVSPRHPDLIVTDEGAPGGGAVVFISRRDGRVVERVTLPKFIGDREPPGRNPLRVCHHPVFDAAGDRVLCNSLPGRHAALVEINVKGLRP